MNAPIRQGSPSCMSTYPTPPACHPSRTLLHRHLSRGPGHTPWLRSRPRPAWGQKGSLACMRVASDCRDIDTQAAVVGVLTLRSPQSFPCVSCITRCLSAVLIPSAGRICFSSLSVCSGPKQGRVPLLGLESLVGKAMALSCMCLVSSFFFSCHLVTFVSCFSLRMSVCVLRFFPSPVLPMENFRDDTA